MASLDDLNYGDELFADRNLENSPFDLLQDTDDIADILFSHNEDAVEISYYNLSSLVESALDDPSDIESYETVPPTNDPDDDTDNLPPTNGKPHNDPDEITDDFVDLSPVGDPPIPDEPSDDEIAEPDDSDHPILPNPICEVPDAIMPEFEIPVEDILDEVDDVYDYLDELDSDAQLALDLIDGLLTDKEQEDWTLDPR